MTKQDQKSAAEQEAAAPGQWTSKLPDPFGRHGIALGDGRSLRLLRSGRFQQAQLEFKAPEGQDAKPDAKYTQWLREHGWTWRSEELAWTKQLARNTEGERFARANSDLAAQLEFIELANLIRKDKGLEPVSQLAEPQRAAGG